MSAPKCSACDIRMRADSFIRHRDGPRSGEQIAQKVTFGYKCECGETARLAEPTVVDVAVGW